MIEVEILYKSKYGETVGKHKTSDPLTAAWDLVNYLTFYRTRNKDTGWEHKPNRLKITFEEG